MNLDTTQARLLDLIEAYKKADNLAECSGIKEELESLKKHKEEAYKQMNVQRKAGDEKGAEINSEVYDFCCKYEKQLENIIDGYVGLNAGKHFTKDGQHRFRNAYPNNSGIDR